MRKSELEALLKGTRRENRRLFFALEGARKDTVACFQTFAREAMHPALTSNAFAAAIGERSPRDVHRFLDGSASPKATARIAPKVGAWLAPKLANTTFTDSVIRALDAGELRDLLFWTRYVARPARSCA